METEVMNKMNHTINAIIFDLGRVLVDVDLTKGIFKYTQQASPKSEKQIQVIAYNFNETDGSVSQN